MLIINGEGGTGKSCLINAIRSYLRGKSEITATTGKAAFNVNGITIHSFLKQPVDEYSMLGQIDMGLDRQTL